MIMPKSVLKYMSQGVDGSSIAFLRAAFGAVMIYWAANHIVYDKISYNYYEPSYLFPYFGWDWHTRWPGRGMHLHFVVTLLAATGIMLGAFYRFCSVLFAACFIYIFLLDKTTYQTHYYFVSLMAVLLIICPVHRCLSFDTLRLNLPRRVPRWSLWLLRFQIGVVYFYGGVAKMNADWLLGYPMRFVLSNKQDHFAIGAFCQEEWFVQFFVWSGMLFDLLIVPMLLYRKTRRLAFLLTVVFHLLNATLFTIGIFPWMMIFATTIFFEPGWPRKFQQYFTKNLKAPASLASDRPKIDHLAGIKGWLLYGFVILFVIAQIVLPLRHYALAENTSWTERNHHFAWHMKLRGKATLIKFYVIEKSTGRGVLFNHYQHLKRHQFLRMSRDPFAIRDFARFIKSYHELKGIPDVAVEVFSLCSLNGRTPQLLVDPTIDLAADELPENWIMPLQEDIGGGWYAPIETWEQLVMEDPILKTFSKTPSTLDTSNRQVEANQTDDKFDSLERPSLEAIGN